MMQYTVRRPSGHAWLSTPEDALSERDTLSCVHCQMTWEIAPGSGRRRGFCLRCNGPTCGKFACETECVPFERALEKAEARDRLRRQVAEALLPPELL